ITLGQVIRGFNVCNDEGKADSTHPWCKLIDPNWVLTAPPFQCSIEGHGDTVFGGTGLRLQECADATSCLKRDDRGKCISGYGYCLAETPVWRFTADECLERFASCRTYQSSAGERVSYLRNTLDYGACSADNVGCMWYATKRDASDQSGATWEGDLQDGPRVYFDATVKTCSASSEGCTRLLEVLPGQASLNLVKNGSFEDSPEEQKDKLGAWSASDPNYKYEAPEVDEGSSEFDGDRSFAIYDKSMASERIMLSEVRAYTLSVYIRSASSVKQGKFGLLLPFLKTIAQPDIATDPGKYYRSAGCTIGDEKIPGIGFNEILAAEPDSSGWRRLVCSFVSNKETLSTIIMITGSNVLVDAIQLEESEVPTSYIDGLAGGLEETHLKVPPEEFACKGRDDDHPLCANYARMCTQQDTGCQGYRDINNPLAPEIPATLSAVDFCPAICVGYAEYRKQASTFDLGKSIDPRLDDPEDVSTAHFIPAYGQQCSLQDVGCEVFTNVEASELGGEEKASFNYVRACEKPGENTETYFTWEGSETTGYQLRTWSLIKQANSNPPRPKIIEKMGPDSILKDPKTCNDVSWQSGADADCRQFFDSNGNAFYAYFSQTVVSSPTCTKYRLDKSNAADCGKTGGGYDPITSQCIYNVLTAASRQCNAVNAGCRAYIGTTGRNTAVVLEERFQGATSTPFLAGSLSNEAILVGDQSLLISDPNPNEQKLATATVFPSGANQLYSLSFWAKTTKPDQPIVTITVDKKVVANFPMGVDWQRYEFGPFTASTDIDKSIIYWEGLPNPTFIDEIRIERLLDVTYAVKDSWTIPAQCDRTPEGLPEPRAMLGCRAYQDRDENPVNVRRFGHLCREDVVGCKAFIDTRDSEDPYLETFEITGTDKNTKIGSNKLPVEPAYEFESKYLGTATTTRVADRYIYLIDDAGARCDSTQASCRAFGKPKFSQTQMSIESPQSAAFETMYFIDDITQYESSDNEPNMLCRKDELFCDEFKSGRTLAYFRNPLNHTCEWKDKVLLKKNDDNGIPQDGEYSGWFMQGQDLPCYKNALSVGNTYLIRNTADVDYWGWVGMCPIEQSECTEFRDTNDTSDPVHPAGKPYFFIKNQRLDVSSCGGEVNLQKGCILFRDLSDARSRYSTDATYNKSKAEGDTPQVPIDCVGDPDNPFCRKCTNLEYKYTDDILQGCLPDKNLCPSIISKCKIDQNYCLGSPEDCSSGFCGVYGFLPNKDYDAQLKECETWKIDLCGRALKTSCELSDPESPPCVVQKKYPPFATAKQDFDEQSCVKDWDCSLAVGQVTTNGLCTKQAVKNDSNVVMKVRLDRDCAQWLGCATAETVFDSVQQKYIDICTETSVCDSSQGSNSGSFCANYVDRDIDPILKPGVFFTREIYTMRKTGFGEIDYSGYIVPEQFLAADVENRKVASEIFQTLPALENKYATDYRLAAAVHESTGLIEFGISNKLYPDLKTICRHTQTGRTGYYLEGIPVGQRTCYLAVDALSERTVSNLPPGEVDPRNIEQLSDVFRQTSDPELDTTLQRSFPPAECKAYPEGDSPFPNLYVKEWKTEFDPPRTEKIADGYGSANLCEYEEDCACSYRKVKYGGQATKYYSPFGKPPAGGICVGGRNDGGECVPGEKAASGSAEPNTTQTIVDDPACPGGSCQEISDVILVRGQFGQCLQRDYSRFVAGDPGRHPCLIWNPSPILASTFDTNHYIPLAGYTPPVNAGEYYCLSQADPPFENTWTALSHTNWDDSTKRIDTVLKNQDGANDYFYLPGKLSKFNYDTGYIAGKCSANSNPCSPAEDDCSCLDGSSSSDEIYGFTSKDRDYEEMYSAAVVPSKGDGVDPYKKINEAGGYTDCHRINKDWTDDDCDEIWRFQNLGVGIDGTKPFQDGGEGPQAQHCATAHNGGADKDHGGPPGASGDPNVKDGIGPLDNPPDADYNYGRWIQTGRGLGNTYTEYFVAVKPSGVAQWLYPDAGEDKLKELRSGAVREKNFAQFQFTPKCDAYTAACSIPTWYVDGVNEPKYTDAAQVANASKQVCSTFSKDFDGMLDRSKEDILVDGNKVPRKEKCTGIDGKTEGIEGNDERCYYKYWETDYRMDGVTKFLWLDDKSGESFYDRKNDYYSREAPCSKSGFSIRALFENASPDQNSLPKDKVKISQLSGPWNFIGFWISACTVGSNNYESALYLGLRVKHADICTDLAQVISPYTRESAAFADRVWNLGNFILPQLGLSYSSQYQPYGSALATGEPGKEPLFQTGGPVENYSKLNPPTFI
ncbi:hypothetical protein KKE33_04885, partial [Patescibacteria group bacterium]|nr:hypothetical protein [Patescibacteria group bacterium]